MRGVLSPDNLSVRDAGVSFMRSMRAAGYSDTYLDGLEMSLAFLSEYAEGQGWPYLDGIGPEQIEDYFIYMRGRPIWYGERNPRRNGDKPSDSYLDVNYRRLSRFFNWLVSRGIIPDTPMRHVQKPRVSYKPVHPVTEEQARRLLAILDPALVDGQRDKFVAIRNRALVYMLWDTPGRNAEIARLLVEGVEYQGREASVEVMGKGRKCRVMTLGRRASEALGAYLDWRERVAREGVEQLWVTWQGYGFSGRDWLATLLERLCERAGVGHIHPHQFRHAFAVNWLRSGKPQQGLEYEGGWRKIPATYFQTIGAADARKWKLEMSPGDALGSVRHRPKARGRL